MTRASDIPPRLIAFYLPQYHPIPENDAWWGKGFTEWTNVVKARTALPGHYQPHLPADLGFYDLRVAEVRAAQAAMARAAGVHGFCYYHYWFGDGRRLLGRPFEEVLSSGQPVFPFCLCWANENWTRRWDGREREVLMAQRYGDDDHRMHVRWLAKAFRDPRYIRVDGRPLFLVYRAGHLPDPARTTALWRAEARSLGLGELYLANVQGHDRMPPGPNGFDAAVEFQPATYALGYAARIGGHDVYSYAAVVRQMTGTSRPPYPRFPCVTPSWDNTARRAAGATILQGATPALYQHWLEQILIREMRAAPGGECPGMPFVFINAWNEWAEGNHLEPDQRWGDGYLIATRNAVRNASSGRLMPAPPELDALTANGAGDPSLAGPREVLQAAAAGWDRQSRSDAESMGLLREQINQGLCHLDRLERLTRTIEAAVPAGETFVLVDDLQLGFGPALRGRRIVPFTERDGEYWGAPADDAHALRELERQTDAGLRHVVVAWPSTWYLDHYIGWAARLRTQFRTVAEGPDVIVFERDEIW
jgi:hypothetical protein